VAPDSVVMTMMAIKVAPNCDDICGYSSLTKPKYNKQCIVLEYCILTGPS